MRQTRRITAAGVGLLLLAAGCEDLPPEASVPVVPTGASPGTVPAGTLGTLPGTVPSGTVATPTLQPTAFPTLPGQVPVGATPVPTPTASASATPTPGPSPTPTVTPTQGPNYQDFPITFLEPTSSTDFSRSNITVKVTATPATGDRIKAIQLYYDNNLIVSQESTDTTLTVNNWNPHVANSINNSDPTPVPFGFHRLRAHVLTEKGFADSETYSFNKPFLFKGWSQNLANSGSSIPPMLAERGAMKAYGRTDRLFAFFGTGAGPEPTVEMLNVNTGSPAWEYRSLGGLQWRDRPTVVGANSKVYVVGGNVPNGSSMAPTPLVTLYDLFQMTTQAAPPLGLPALPVADAAGAVFGNYLYLVGGTTNGQPGGATGNAYRLPLNGDGEPSGGSWEVIRPLPSNVRRLGGALVAYNSALYFMGGQDERGNRSEYVFRYDPTANSWSTARFLHRGLSHAAVTVMGGDIWIFGGYTNIFPPITKEVVRYRPESGVTTNFQSDVALPVGRAGAGVATVNGHVYLLGGTELDDQANEVPSDEVLRADTL